LRRLYVIAVAVGEDITACCIFAKHHFYRALWSAVLGSKELRTLLCHIGADINSLLL